MYIPKLLQNTRKTTPKTSKYLQQMIKKLSKMSPGAPPETPRARDLFLMSFLMFFGPKWAPKWSQKRSEKYVIFACFSDTVVLRFLSEKLSLLMYFWDSFWGFSQLWEIMKMMLPCRREHQFRGPRPPKSIQNPLKTIPKTDPEKSPCFIDFCTLLAPFGPPKNL